MTLGVLVLMRPCSKKICKCYDQAIKLSLRIPISKPDEKKIIKDIDKLYIHYRLCTRTFDRGQVLHERPFLPYYN